ncbi:MAG: hypothetical protein ACLGHQ_04585, partial [Acidimicrobiia bacterium]
MTVTDPTAPDPVVPGPTAGNPAWARRRAALRSLAREFWASRPGRVGVLILLVFVLLALAAPLVADRTGLDTAFARANDVPQ